MDGSEGELWWRVVSREGRESEEQAEVELLSFCAVLPRAFHSRRTGARCRPQVERCENDDDEGLSDFFFQHSLHEHSNEQTQVTDGGDSFPWEDLLLPFLVVHQFRIPTMPFSAAELMTGMIAASGDTDTS